MSNYYVIGNSATVPSLAGTPYAGYTVVTQSQISNWIGSYDLKAGDNVVVSGSTSGSIDLHSRTAIEGGSLGEKVTVTVLDNTNTLDLKFSGGGGFQHLQPTVNIVGQSPNTTISATNTNAATINVADGATVGDITTGSGADTINTGVNSTVGTISTGSGDDRVTVNGTSSNIDTGDGKDSVTVGANAHAGTVNTGAGDDTISVGAGAHTGNIDTGNGSDGLTLGDGAHVGNIDLGFGGTMGDTITGGNNVSTGGITQAISDSDATVTLGDNTTITGNVNLHGGHDHMTIGAGSTVNGSITMGDDGSARDDDTLTIGAGSTITDYINTNTGNDTVTVGDNVTLLGGWNAIDTELGDDVVILGHGVVAKNPIFTGAGSDKVIVNGSGSYTVDQGIVVPNNDVVELNYKPGTEADFASTLSAAGYKFDASTGLWFKASNGTLTYKGVTLKNIDYIRGVTCFTPGTMILTPEGEVAVETRKAGDLVMTRDRGAQPIRWIGSRTISAAELALSPETRPVRIAAGALGAGLPAADLTVSHWHRMLVRSTLAAEVAGSDEVLVAACNLTDLPGVDHVEDGQPVTYIHFMCDQHELVTANGAPTESLNVGINTTAALSPEACAEILALFPELAQGPQTPVRPPVRGAEGREMIRRHIDAGLALA